jgi:transcriptional regulator with XRE-family HTH domain
MNIEEKKKLDNIAFVFGRRLVELRKGRQLTQAQLAEKIGISRGMIAYYESWAKNPTLEAVQKVADFFGVSPDTLITKKDSELIKPGPDSKLDQQMKRIKKLSPTRRRMIVNMLEGALNTD